MGDEVWGRRHRRQMAFTRTAKWPHGRATPIRAPTGGTLTTMTERAQMISGVFLLSHDPEALAAWYGRHLGWKLELLPDEGYYREI
jgi:hypothetical protein